MSDLSLLTRRIGGSFARDRRFAPADALDVPPLAEAVVSPTPEAADPLVQAHADGFAEGVAAAQAQAQAVAIEAGADRLRVSFSRLDAELAETLRQRLLTTVVALCETAMAPLALDIPALVARVARAAAMFARADDERVIRLHPDDLALAEPMLPPDWNLKPDAALPRGALRVETPGGGVEDGPDQWRAAIVEALERC